MSEQILDIDFSCTSFDSPGCKCVPESVRIRMNVSFATKSLEKRAKVVLVGWLPSTSSVNSEEQGARRFSSISIDVGM